MATATATLTHALYDVDPREDYVYIREYGYGAGISVTFSACDNGSIDDVHVDVEYDATGEGYALEASFVDCLVAIVTKHMDILTGPFSRDFRRAHETFAEDVVSFLGWRVAA